MKTVGMVAAILKPENVPPIEAGIGMAEKMLGISVRNDLFGRSRHYVRVLVVVGRHLRAWVRCSR